MMLSKLPVMFAFALGIALNPIYGQGSDSKKYADVLDTTIVACPTNGRIGADGVTIATVDSCGKFWKIVSGKAKVTSDGMITASVTGLVLNDSSVPADVNGTPDGVTGLAATLVCGGESGTIAGQTDVVPISRSGDATMSGKIDLPSSCDTPIVLIREQYEGMVFHWLARSKP